MKMKTVGLFDAKNRLSELCDRVAKTGEPCQITRRGRALVRIVPVQAAEADSVWSSWDESRRRHGALKDDFELPVRKTAARRSSPI